MILAFLKEGSKIFSTVQLLAFVTISSSSIVAQSAFQKSISLVDSLYNSGDDLQLGLVLDSLENLSSGFSPTELRSFELRKALRPKTENDQKASILGSLHLAFHESKDTVNEEYAYVLEALGNLESLENQQERAIQFYELSKALRKKLFGEKSAAYARSLNNIGLAYREAGDYENMYQHFKEAAEIRAQVLGRNHPEFTASLYNLAWTNRVALNDNAAADSLYKECVQRRKEIFGNKHLLYAKAINSYAIHNSNLNRDSLAEVLYLESLAIFKDQLGPVDKEYLVTNNNLGQLYTELGQFDAAEKIFKESLTAIAENMGTDNSQYAFSLRNLGTLYFNMGDHYLADSLYQQCKKIRAEIFGEAHPLYAEVLLDLGINNNKIGEYEKAETAFLKCLEIRKEVFGEEHMAYAVIISKLGNLYRSIGSIDKAEPYYKETVEIARKANGEKHPNYAAALSHLGGYYLDAKNYVRAEELYRQTLDLVIELLGESHPAYSIVLSNLADAYLAQSKFDEAEAAYSEALAFNEKLYGKENQNYISTISKLGSVYFKKGTYSAAVPLLSEALETTKKIQGANNVALVKYYTDLGWSYKYLGEQDKALEFALRATELKTELLANASGFLSEDEMLKYQTNVVVGFDFIKSLAEGSDDAMLAEKLYDLALFEKGQLLSSSIEMKNYIQEASEPELKATYEQLIQKRKNLGQQMQRASSAQQTLDELKAAIEADEKRIAKASASFRKEINLSKVTKESLVGMLEPEELAIEFIQYDELEQDQHVTKYAALVLDPVNAVVSFVSLFEEDELSIFKTVNATRSDIVNTYYSPHQEEIIIRGQRKRSLYDLIWRPLETHLKNKSKIYYASVGFLNKLNLNAIQNKDGKVMADTYQMHNLFSTRSLSYEKELSSGNNAMIIGDVNYDKLTDEIYSRESSQVNYESYAEVETESFLLDRSLLNDHWPHLPSTTDECKNISLTLESADYEVSYLSDGHATEEAFKQIGQEGNSANIIHLATHGFFFPDPQEDVDKNALVFKVSEDPMLRSGLLLAGANITWSGAQNLDKEDGILTAYEIANMNLNETQLVVLSACETGLGDIIGTEGVYGLQRAFKKAGVQHLIMSLWKVSDEETSVFMKRFYTYWIRDNHTIRAAFTKAQQEMKDKYIDPYKWAGFILLE